MLHIRCRKGSANTQRGAGRFGEELIARVRRAGADGTILIRADSGFENKRIRKALRERGVQHSIAVKRHKHVREAIEQIDEDAWQTLAESNCQMLWMRE